MSFFNQLGGQPRQNMNPMQMMSQFRQDPIGALTKAGYNIPQGLNNPQQIIQHLLQTGQINNNKLAMLQRMAGGMR